MPHAKKRQAFETGHQRKFLVVVDESPEFESALIFAARVAKRTGGTLVLLYVIEPQDFQHWIGVREVQREEEMRKAEALFRLSRRKLKNHDCEVPHAQELVREGSKAEEIIKLIEEDADIAILVLGASSDPEGPGPLVSTLAAGKEAGSFPIPIYIVPGTLKPDEIMALA